MEIDNSWATIFNKSKEKMIVMNEANKEMEILEAKNFFDRPLLGKILILQRRNAEQFKYDKPWACISISDNTIFYQTNGAEISEENRVDILRLQFDDTEFSPKDCINDEQAQSIIDFTEAVWDKIDILMIHCNAGSRSPAVGKVLSEIYQPEFERYFDQFYSPNRLVVSKLKLLI